MLRGGGRGRQKESSAESPAGGVRRRPGRADRRCGGWCRRPAQAAAVADPPAGPPRRAGALPCGGSARQSMGWGSGMGEGGHMTGRLLQQMAPMALPAMPSTAAGRPAVPWASGGHGLIKGGPFRCCWLPCAAGPPRALINPAAPSHGASGLGFGPAKRPCPPTLKGAAFPLGVGILRGLLLWGLEARQEGGLCESAATPRRRTSRRPNTRSMRRAAGGRSRFNTSNICACTDQGRAP